jgi:hypothetical protein
MQTVQQQQQQQKKITGDFIRAPLKKGTGGTTHAKERDGAHSRGLA